jgi:trk system potassium uptake protein TrkA
MPRILSQFRKKEFVVIGLGRFGGALARRLEENGNSVLGIDEDPAVVQAISRYLTEAVIFDATDQNALEAVDAAAFESAIVAIGEDFEAAALVTSMLKEMGVAQVISLGESRRHRNLLARIGADRVVLPLQAEGRRLADELSLPAILDRLPLGREQALAEVKAPAGMVGQSLARANLTNRYRLNIVVIIRREEIIAAPSGDFIVQADDILVVIGDNENITAFSSQA